MDNSHEDLQSFLSARDFLLRHRTDYDTAYRQFRWPRLRNFNWALDYFDAFAAGNPTSGLCIVDESGSEDNLSFHDLSRRSGQVANFLKRSGVGRGDRLIVMLPNVVAIWEITLAAIKLGAVLIPTATTLTVDDLRDRLTRGRAACVVASAENTQKFANVPGQYTRVVVGGSNVSQGWTAYERAYRESFEFVPDELTRPGDSLLLYFTSGTTATPKLVLHTQQSYPVGHLITMYWIGLQPGDVHMNISSPGWAKHAWSSFFAPWNAGATIVAYNYDRFDSKRTLEVIARRGVTTLCAPPTAWRMLVREDLSAVSVKLREAVSAGEPLNPEVIERVRSAWGITIRDGFGQTENVCLLGNFPGQKVKPGAVGKPSPGHRIVLLDPDGAMSNQGQIAVELHLRPPSLMAGYVDDPERTRQVMGGEYYLTGDVAQRDDDGYFTYVGRADDIFKSSDYRISPFELESALIEHEAIMEAAVVPSPDSIRWMVPKAFIVVSPGLRPSKELACDIFRFVRTRLGSHKRVRRIEFADLPKTISGKIRRVQLRAIEQSRQTGERRPDEFWEEDFPEL